MAHGLCYTEVIHGLAVVPRYVRTFDNTDQVPPLLSSDLDCSGNLTGFLLAGLEFTNRKIEYMASLTTGPPGTV
jgi:hypothetical protein